MYIKHQQLSITAQNFVIPNQIKLDENNRWVVMADLIPWPEFEQLHLATISVKSLEEFEQLINNLC